jgi:putative lipoprotein
MKYQKFVMVGAGLVLSLVLTACGGSPQQNTQSTAQPQTKQEQQAPAKKDFDGSKQAEVGEGSVMLATASGTTENGNVPKLTIQKDTQLTQIEVDTKDLNRSAVTHIYVDGIENTKGNYGDSQNAISLTGDALKAGDHTVEVVQFKGDDASGEVVFYRKLSYQIAN